MADNNLVEKMRKSGRDRLASKRKPSTKNSGLTPSQNLALIEGRDPQLTPGQRLDIATRSGRGSRDLSRAEEIETSKVQKQAKQEAAKKAAGAASKAAAALAAQRTQASLRSKELSRVAGATSFQEKTRISEEIVAQRQVRIEKELVDRLRR